MKSRDVLAFAGVVLVVLAIGLSGGMLFLWRQSITRPVSKIVASSPTPPRMSHGMTFTSAEAGIPETPVAGAIDAYIRKIEERNDRLWITIDPAQFVSCRVQRNTGQLLPKGCHIDQPDQSYVILNADKGTQTFEMATSSGPYFINVIGDASDGKPWRTMDLVTMQGLLTGTVESFSATLLPEYYTPSLTDRTSLFVVMKQGNRVSKVFQRYFE